MAGGPGDLDGKSVTELEILHGVLNAPEMADRALFYFRDPAYAQARGADFLSESAESAVKQRSLKEAIRATCAAKGIPLREDYADPRQLAAMVLEDLSSAIEEQYPEESVPDPLTREARDHEAFAESRRRVYIGRPDYFAALDRHAAEDGGPLVLLGESGGGKSALLANWLAAWRRDHPEDFLFQHYIGSTPDSADHWRLITRLMAEIKRWTGDPEELPRSHDELLKAFPVWLAKARIKADRDGVRAIVLFDALNQLEDQDRARLLGWLPSHPFSGPLRLVVSTLPGESLEAVSQRGWPSLRVEPLSPDERRRMIADYLQRFGKKLDPPRLERLAAAPAAANPLYLKILLDKLRVTGTHEGLDERLGDYLAAPDIPALLRKVLTRYRRDYDRDREGLVGEALSLVWAARRGLTESELLRLLRPANLPQLPLAAWAPLRAALEEGLVSRGGVLNFAHDFLRAAVEASFVPDAAGASELRLRLADEFQSQAVTARTCDELPWLLRMAEARDRLRACLLDIDRFLEIHKRDQNELLGYWVGLHEERAMGTAYLASFERWSEEPSRAEQQISYAINALAYFLHTTALHAEAELLMRRALVIDEGSYGPDHPKVASDLNNLTSLLKATNRLAKAESLMRRALAIDEQSYGSTEEVRLRTYESARQLDHLHEMVLRALSAGVSGREMAEVHPESPDVSKSSVSRLWVEAGRKLVDELRTRDIATRDWLVLMFDGIVLSKDQTAIVAIGVASDGTKHVLDFELGSTEHYEVCRDLVRRLVERGFATSRRLLAVLDGSSALKKAVVKFFPDAVIQRCLVHKERNIRARLSKRDWGELARLFKRLREVQGEEAAREVLGELERFLGKKNAEALASLREAGEELIALHVLGVPSTLHKSLLSTNLIENSFRNTRRKVGRVTRFRAETD